MPLANRTRAGRRDCGGGATFCAALCAALCAMRSRKRPCQPKTAKRFFGGPGSQSPSGQAKERTRILPVRRGSFCPACRAMCRAGCSCAASRCCVGFCARCPGVFSASAACARGILWHCLSCLSALCRGHRFFAAFSREAQGGIFPFSAVFRRFVPDLRAAFLPPLRRLLRLFVWPALPLPAVRFVCAVLFCFGCLFACSMLVARAFFSYLLSFAFSCLAFAAQTSFHLSLRPRRALSCLSPPRLCSRPVWFVTCCFFADFCAHCLFACSALFMRALSCFFALSCLTSFSQTSFHLSLRPRRASTFFRKESRQRFARGRGSAPFEPPFQRPAVNQPLFLAAGRLSGLRPQTAGR